MRNRIDAPTDEELDFRGMAVGLLSNGYTTTALAKALGLSQPAVSRLATGKQRTIGPGAAIRLIRLAGGSVEVPKAPQVERAAA